MISFGIFVAILTTATIVWDQCYAAMTAKAPLQPFEITRRAMGPLDVAIQTK
jgi:hypothetical protein